METKGQRGHRDLSHIDRIVIAIHISVHGPWTLTQRQSETRKHGNRLRADTTITDLRIDSLIYTSKTRKEAIDVIVQGKVNNEEEDEIKSGAASQVRRLWSYAQHQRHNSCYE